jgi:hypothetical protein
MSRFVSVTCPSVSGLGRLSLFQSRSSIPCTPFLVSGPSWCQHCSGISIAPVAAPLWCEEMLTNISSGDLLGFAPSIRKALVSAKSWCQQSSPVIFLLPSHFFSRHPSSPFTLPPPHFLSCYCRSPITPSLVCLSGQSKVLKDLDDQL